MRKLFFALFMLSAILPLTAQEEEDQEPKEGWTTEGKIQLLFNQSAFNEEWTGGGTSSIAGNLDLNYIFSYRRDNFTWDNKFLANYGMTKVNGDEFARKTSDALEFNTIAGWQINQSNWYYSLFGNFRTQITKGYEFSEDPLTGETLRTETTNFLSPAYLQAGPGLMWKKSEDFYFNIAPATVRFILVDDKFTTTPGYIDGAYFGVDQGESSRFELGASFTGYAKFGLFENVSMENSLSLYSNYLEEPGNIDIDYLMNLGMGINDFLTANLLFQAIYDDNAVAAFQIREVLGVGITYVF